MNTIELGNEIKFSHWYVILDIDSRETECSNQLSRDNNYLDEAACIVTVKSFLQASLYRLNH
jgi:hypothetical protein